MSTGFKSPVLIAPSGIQNVNIISPIPLRTMHTAASSVITRISSSLTNVTLLAANVFRKGLLIYNDSTAFQFIKLGITATTTDFTVRLTPHMFYEIQPIYTGQVDVISSSTDGAIQVTELT